MRYFYTRHKFKLDRVPAGLCGYAGPYCNIWGDCGRTIGEFLSGVKDDLDEYFIKVFDTEEDAVAYSNDQKLTSRQ